MRFTLTVVLLIVGLAGAAGCMQFDYPDGTYACTPGEANSCPPGFSCRWSANDNSNRCFEGSTDACGPGSCDGCCSGAGDTAQCLAGDQVAACGTGGVACAVCAEGLGCSAGGCGSSVSCGDGAVTGTEVCDGSDLAGQDCTTLGLEFTGGVLACQADCDGFASDGCVTPPVSWTCDPVGYGAGDGCHCGCGALDLDCADATVDSCQWCEGAGSCGSGNCLVDIDPSDNTQCPLVITGWTCSPAWYDAGDGCDCGCGLVDPDCADADVSSCVSCDRPGSCGTGGCPANIASSYNGLCNCSSRSHQWSQGFGSLTSDNAAVVAVNELGEVVMAGTFSGTMTFGGTDLTAIGDQDLYLAKLDAAGNHLWSQRFGTTTDEVEPQAIAFDRDGNIVMAGHFRGTASFGLLDIPVDNNEDAFVAKYTADGSPLWDKHLHGFGAIHGWDMALDSLNNVFIVGDFKDSLFIDMGQFNSHGSEDMFVCKLDPDGDVSEVVAFGDFNGFGRLLAVAVDDLDNVILGGVSSGPSKLGASPAGAGTINVELGKFDNGLVSPLWIHSYGYVDASSELHDVAVDRDNNVVFAMGFETAIDLAGVPVFSANTHGLGLAKLDPGGAYQWSQIFDAEGGVDSLVCNGLSVDEAGQITLGANYEGTVSLGGPPLPGASLSDIGVATFDVSGYHLYSAGFGGVGTDSLEDLAAGPSRTVVIVGSFENTLDFGGNPLTAASASQPDAFVALFGCN